MQFYRKVELLKDESRIETFQGEGFIRKLAISIYYPSLTDQIDKNITVMKYTELFQPCEQKAVEILRDIGMNIELLDTCSTNVLHSKAPQKWSHTYPVIIFTPALGLDRDMYMYSIEELVKQGFIVFTISAPYEAMFTVFPTGEFLYQSELMRQISSDNYRELNELISIRKKDIKLLLDYLPILNAEDETLSGCLELDQIAIIGHSLGGIAALEAAAQDERIKATVLLDPSMQLFREEFVEKKKMPPTLLLRQGASDLEQLKLKLGEEIASRYIEGQKQLYQNLHGCGAFIKVHNATHMSFSDLPLFEENIALNHKTREIHGIINESVIAFLEQHLCKKIKTVYLPR